MPQNSIQFTDDGFDRERGVNEDLEASPEAVRDHSRRGFLRMLTSAVAAPVALQAIGCISPDDAANDDHERLLNIEQVSLSINELRALLSQRYPELCDDQGNCRFRPLGIEKKYETDDLVRSYMRLASYHDLLEDGIVQRGDMIERMQYLNPEKMWKRKIELAVPNHKEDCRRAKANLEPFGEGNGGLDMQGFMDICKKAEERVKAKASELGLDSPFMDVIDADLLMGISIHEVIPTDYNQTTRIAILRTLFEEGLEINKIPAMHDSVASFGPVQMTVIPYEGRTRRHSYNQDPKQGDIERYLDDFDLPKKLHDCVDLEDQMVAAMLLQLRNMKWLFNRRLSRNVRFMELWSQANDTDRRGFIATLLGTAHNNPANSKRAIEQAIGWNRRDSADYHLDDNPSTEGKVETLDDLRIAYYNIAKRGHGISGRHGVKTGLLVREFSRYGLDSQVQGEGANPRRSNVSEDSTEPTPAEFERTTTMLQREKQGKAFYTYTVPNWKLARFLEATCGRSDDIFIAEIKRFNNTERFNPGDVVNLPISSLKPDLRSREVVEIRLPSTKTPHDFIYENLGGDSELEDIAVVYTAKNAVSEIDELEGVIRLPKPVVKAEWFKH